MGTWTRYWLAGYEPCEPQTCAIQSSDLSPKPCRSPAVIGLLSQSHYVLGHGWLNVLFSYTECPPPGPGNLTNGLVEGTGSVYRSTYRFACNDGYVLLGHDTVSCTENGTWNGTTPRCLRGNKLDQKSFQNSMILFMRLNVGRWLALLVGSLCRFLQNAIYSCSAFYTQKTDKGYTRKHKK